MTDLSDDEISDLAECLHDACVEAEREGFRLKPDRNDGFGQFCPLEALFGPGNYLLETSPMPWDIQRAIVAGFDNDPLDPDWDLRIVAVGRRFREQALSGEGFR